MCPIRCDAHRLPIKNKNHVQIALWITHKLMSNSWMVISRPKICIWWKVLFNHNFKHIHSLSSVAVANLCEINILLPLYLLHLTPQFLYCSWTWRNYMLKRELILCRMYKAIRISLVEVYWLKRGLCWKINNTLFSYFYYYSFPETL